jgi:hypothetical protein
MSHRKNDYDDDEHNEISGLPLTIAERRIVRRMIINEGRIQWFWGSVRVWAAWISGAIIGAWALVEIVGKIWKRSL